VKFNIGDRVRFTYPPTNPMAGQFYDGTVSKVGEYYLGVYYDNYAVGRECTPGLTNITLLATQPDETEAFFV